MDVGGSDSAGCQFTGRTRKLSLDQVCSGNDGMVCSYCSTWEIWVVNIRECICIDKAGEEMTLRLPCSRWAGLMTSWWGSFVCWWQGEARWRFEESGRDVPCTVKGGRRRYIKVPNETWVCRAVKGRRNEEGASVLICSDRIRRLVA